MIYVHILIDLYKTYYMYQDNCDFKYIISEFWIDIIFIMVFIITQISEINDKHT